MEHIESADDLWASLNLNQYQNMIKAGRSGGNNFSQFLLRDGKGNAVENHPMHTAIQEFYDYCKTNNKWALIQVWMGAGKTEQIIARIVQEIVEDREQRILVVCESDDPAKQRVTSIKKYIESVDKLFNLEITNNADTEIFVNRKSLSKDPTVSAKGIFSAGLGKRVDLLLMDDIETANNAIKNDMQKQVITAVKSTWFTRIDRDGMVVVLGTKFSKNGVLANLENDSRFNTLRIGINDDLMTYYLEQFEGGKQTRDEQLPNWNYYKKIKFEEARKDSPLIFQLAYQLKIEALEKTAKFTNIEIAKSNRENLDKFIAEAREAKAYKEIFAVDLSGGARAGTVITKSIGNTQTGNLFFALAYYLAVSWVELRDKIIELNGVSAHWIIEKNGLQAHLIPLIREKLKETQERWGSTQPIKIIQHYTGTNKNDLASGILALDNDFSNGKIKFNCDNAGIKQIVDEFYSYGGKGYFDGVMTVWFTAYNRKKILRKRDIQLRQNEYIDRDDDINSGVKYITY